MAATNENVLTTSCAALTQQEHAAVSEEVPEKHSNVVASRSVLKDTDHLSQHLQGLGQQLILSETSDWRQPPSKGISHR